MGKRKGTPVQITEEKRQFLSWNMLEGTTGTSGSLTIDNANSGLLHEIQETEKVLSNQETSKDSKPEVSSFVNDSYSNEELQDILNALLADCLFYIPLSHHLSSLSSEETYFFGTLTIKWCSSPHMKLPPIEFPQNSNCWLYVSEEPNKSLLYFELQENDENAPSEKTVHKSITFWCVEMDIPIKVLDALQSKKLFQVVIQSYNGYEKTLSVGIHGTSNLLSKPDFPSSAVRFSKTNAAIQAIVCYFNNIIVETYKEEMLSKKHDIQELYDTVKSGHDKVAYYHGIDIQHDDLRPQLRLYQKEAVNWMLFREHFNKYKDTSKEKELHMLYQEIYTLDNKKLYFNKLAGRLVSKFPCQIEWPPGGILADEMGLGKTVEMLACIMNHRRSNVRLPDPLPTLTVKRENRCTICKFILQDMESNLTDSKGLKYEGQISGYDFPVSESKSDLEKLVENGENYLEIEEFSKDLHEFGCVCGSFGENDVDSSDKWSRQKRKVQCVKCGQWLHADCVNYDLKNPYRGKFMCPHCHVMSPPVVSGATLIISPASICHQWIDEITKHVKRQSLRVFLSAFVYMLLNAMLNMMTAYSDVETAVPGQTINCLQVYTGVGKQGFIQPETLAQQDIVITTYETLRKEIYFTNIPESNGEPGKGFRFMKKFMALPSPIIAVDWWRICLDEAQMVESTSTKPAEMALKLCTVNRWCTTGTPIQKSVEDLYGLLLFLGTDPYWVKNWFDQLLYKPLCHGVKGPMYELVSKVLWRTVKKDVLDQVDIPEQTEHIHWLTFSPVEDHFYKRQYDTSINDSLKGLSKWTDHSIKLSSLDRNTLNQLLYPLLRLRQACCHPQAVRGEFIPLHLSKSAMTMEELLDSLIKKATVECEEAHRLLVAAYNGLAGWHIIKQQYVEAVEMYREVLRSIEEHKERLRTDDLQLLHTLYNLNEVLSMKPEGVQPTLRDDQLGEQIKDIEKKYRMKSKSVVFHVQEQLAPLRADIQKYRDELKTNRTWWLEAIHLCKNRELDENLVIYVKEEIDKDKGSKTLSMSRSFRNARGLELILDQRLVALEKAFEAVRESVTKLSEEPTQELINEVTDCCLRPVGAIQATCPFCKTSLLFEEYESKLFSFSERGITAEGDDVSTKRQGTWADSDIEKALKAILSFAKLNLMDQSLIEYGQIHLKLMDSLKKEFKPFRNLWIELKAYTAAFDEISMATTRLRLRLPDEPKPDNTQMNILEPSELEHHKLKLMSDRTVAKNELRKKLGQQLYLKTMAKAEEGQECTENHDTCPICQRELGQEWSALHCGHCYCLNCIRILCEQYSFGGRNRIVTCALCREKTYHSDISYVSTIKKKTEINELNVKGSHSSKIQGVVKCLKQIQQEDPGAKTLIFSTWPDVLNVISQAMDENNLPHKMLQSGSRFQKNLSLFKEKNEVIALLLPFHLGANGLNLIEATYVLLVEPVLNPAQELQAIGRVHRIGQTKPTQVHRFLVKGTIEEKMYSMLKAFARSASSHDTEENVLTIGDLTNMLKADNETEEMDSLTQDRAELDPVPSTSAS